MKQLSRGVSLVLLLFSSYVASELKLNLELKKDILYFTAENWHYESSAERINMCFITENGIEVGNYVNGEFKVANVYTYLNQPCFIQDPKHLGPYEIVGVINSLSIIDKIFKLREVSDQIGFRICVENKCTYSNIVQFERKIE
jgi:hypothetical protein